MFPGFAEFKAITDKQQLNSKLRIGQYKDRRYFCVWLPYEEEHRMYQLPSKAYFEFKPEEEQKAREFENASQGSVTWLWYQGKIDYIGVVRKSVTEQYVEGLKFTGEMGYDCNWDNIDEIEKDIKERIDEFDSFEPEESRKRKREEECKDCETSEEKCVGCDKGLCCRCAIPDCCGEECDGCELSPYNPDDYDQYHKDCYVPRKRQKESSETSTSNNNC